MNLDLVTSAFFAVSGGPPSDLLILSYFGQYNDYIVMDCGDWATIDILHMVATDSWACNT